jgi:hypothetical protein
LVAKVINKLGAEGKIQSIEGFIYVDRETGVSECLLFCLHLR